MRSLHQEVDKKSQQDSSNYMDTSQLNIKLNQSIDISPLRK